MNQKSLSDKNTEAAVISQSNSAAKKILVRQIIITLLVAFAFFYYHNLFAVQSVIFGGMIAMLNVWLADRKLQAAAEMAKLMPDSEVNLLYIGAVQRFISTLALFIIGMFVLKLMPFALVSTFAAAQLAYLFKSVE